MNSRLLTIFFIFLFSLSCAQKGSKTPLKVSVGAITGSAVFTGGLLISGKSTQGLKFIKLVGSNDELFLEIPNGNWTFTAIGWDGSQKFEGNSFCDFKTNINLAGEQVDLNMSVTSAKCAHPHYGGQTVAAGFNPVVFNQCTDIQKELQKDGSAAAPMNMTCNGNDQPFPGTAKSFKLFIPENDFNTDGSPHFLGAMGSQCYNATDARVSSNIRVPWGSSMFNLPYLVRAYPNTSCTGNPITYDYRSGFQNLAFNSLGGATPNTSTMKMDLYMDVARCSGDQLTKQPFAAGSTSANRYLICSAAQLVNIAKAANTSCPSNTLSMGCEVEAVYELGKDINLLNISAPTSNAYIMESFKGEFFGNDFTISNGVRPLFQTIANPTSPSDHPHEFRDVTLSNFTLSFTPTTPATDNIGIFVNNITHTGANADIDLENVKIDSSSSLAVTDPGGAGAYGGLIGSINHSGSSYWTEIKNNQQLADVSTTSTNTSHSVGGLVGKIIGPSSGTDNGVALELNAIGADLNDGSNQTLGISIIGQQKIGGIVGNASDAEIRFGNFIRADITGVNIVGGLVGFASAVGETRIENSMTDITFIPSATAQSIGGVVGKVNGAGTVRINGNATKLLINSTTTQVDYVGGIVGSKSSGVASGLEINNSRAFLETYSNGAYYGGFIGYFNPTTASPNMTIANSVASGTIGVNSTAPSINMKRGGFAGSATHLKTRMNIAEFNITGGSYLGGVIGYSSTSYLEESYAKSTITANAATNIYVSGGIGEAITDNSLTVIKNSKIDTTITLSSSTANCDTVFCGRIIGKASTDNSTPGFSDGTISLGSITKSDTSQENIDCGYMAAACTGSVLTSNIKNNYTSDNSTTCSSLNSNPFAMDSTNTYCSPLFEKQWKKYGYDTNNNYYIAGSPIEPFQISTPAQWNAIADDAFLMNKSFELTANINFSDVAPANNFVMMGSSTNKFRGTIIGNGFKFLNGDKTFQSGASQVGFISNAENARIGLNGSPLHFENFTLIFDGNTSGGLIGRTINSDVSVQANDMNYTDVGSSTDIGGLVGLASYSLNINDSKFVGSLNLQSATNVGGLIGSIEAQVQSDITVEKSFVNLSTIKAGTLSGGFFGRFYGSGATPNVDINQSYLTFSLGSATDISIANFGGVIGNIAYNINMHESYLDFKNLNDKSVTSSNIKPIAFSGAANTIIFNLNTARVDTAILGTTDTIVNTNATTPILPSSHLDLTNNNIDFESNKPNSLWTMGNDGKLHLPWE